MSPFHKIVSTFFILFLFIFIACFKADASLVKRLGQSTVLKPNQVVAAIPNSSGKVSELKQQNLALERDLRLLEQQVNLLTGELYQTSQDLQDSEKVYLKEKSDLDLNLKSLDSKVEGLSVEIKKQIQSLEEQINIQTERISFQFYLFLLVTFLLNLIILLLWRIRVNKELGFYKSRLDELEKKTSS